MLLILIYLATFIATVYSKDYCRERSNRMRLDGGLCFEVPPWQHQPVDLDLHLTRLRERWGVHRSGRTMARSSDVDYQILDNGEVSRAMDSLLAPFLDTYLQNMQTSYQQLTNKILGKAREEIKMAVQKRQQIASELGQLADELKVPELCNMERRESKTLASKHLAHIYDCTEAARLSITEMGKYTEEMVKITKDHMQSTLDKALRREEADKSAKSKDYGKVNVTILRELARVAVTLGYELDLSLTNARRHNEQSCEKMVKCNNRVKKETEDDVANMKELLYQCVYA